MKNLKSNPKITLSTLKAFAKRNSSQLFSKCTRDFDGMDDCVGEVEGKFIPTQITSETGCFKTGIQGIYTVGSSRDYFNIYEDDTYFGITVYNCCGSSILAIKK